MKIIIIMHGVMNVNNNNVCNNGNENNIFMWKPMAKIIMIIMAIIIMYEGSAIWNINNNSNSNNSNGNSNNNGK
jgi:hypothetical protein